MNLIHTLSARASHLYIQIWHVISGKSHRRFKQLQRDWVVSQQSLANAERQIAELQQSLTTSQSQETRLTQDLTKVVHQRNQLQHQLDEVSQQLQQTVSVSQQKEAELTQNLQKVEQKYLTLQKEREQSTQTLHETVVIAQQEKAELEKQLADLESQKIALQKDLDDLSNYFDTEVQILEADLEKHQEALATCQVDLGFARATSYAESSEEEDSTLAPEISLVDWKIALIGGHENTTRGVRQKLSQGYGLQTMIEIPSIHMSQQQLKQKLGNCDLIVSIVRYSNHPLTTSISELKSKGALRGEILPVNCRGVSGVVRDIMAFVASKQNLAQGDSQS